MTTIVIAMVTAAVTAGSPAVAGVIADYARDADRVDGKDAVRASASHEERAGNLVATNRYGYLPNTIIHMAQNADRLDGLSQGAFARRSVLDQQVGRIASTNTWDAGPVTASAWDVTSVIAQMQVRLPRDGALKLEWNAWLWCQGRDEALLRFYVDNESLDRWFVSCESDTQRTAAAKSQLVRASQGDHIVEVRAVDWGASDELHLVELWDSYLMATFYPRGLGPSGDFFP